MRGSDAMRVGATVIGAALLLVLIDFGIHGFPFWSQQRKVRVAFPNAQGLQQRAEVMVEGVTVGEVQSVDLVGGRPVASLVFNKRNLPGHVRIRIASPLLGFTGPHVELVPTDETG